MKQSFTRRTLLVALALATVVVAARVVDAAKIDVFPGSGTLQAAIDAAEPGSQLLLHPGVYTGGVVVTKPLKIECMHDFVNDGGCIIDAECGTATALDIASDGVSLKLSNKKISGASGGPFVVRRGSTFGIRIDGRKKVKITGLQTTGLVLCGTEQAGFELSGALYSVKLKYVSSLVGALARFHLSGIPAGSKVLLDRSYTTAYTNEPGILFENSGAATAGPGTSGIKVTRGSIGIVGSNAIGVKFVNSDGVRFEKNYIVPNPNPETPITGISLDATSDDNYFAKNTWNDTEMDETAFSDAGTGNCGKDNIGFTTPICP